MHALWMKKSHDVAGGSDGARGRPLEFQHQHGLISHAAGSTEDSFDGGIDRLDHAEPDLVIAVGGDPVEMLEFVCANREYILLKRNHQGLDNRLIVTPMIDQAGRRATRPRLGGLLNFYERAA